MNLISEIEVSYNPHRIADYKISDSSTSCNRLEHEENDGTTETENYFLIL